jgi:hypothetical protein
MKQQMGGKFKWSKVSESQMIDLGERMFDAAGVPQEVRNMYWTQFGIYRASLSE